MEWHFARVNIETKRERKQKEEKEREREKKKRVHDESHVPKGKTHHTTRFANEHDRTFEPELKKMEKELSAAPALLDFSVTVCVTELSERLLLEGGDWRYHHATLRSPTSPFLFLYAPRSLRRGRPQALLGSVQDPPHDREHPRVGSVIRVVSTVSFFHLSLYRSLDE